ncbi:hypothetical protein B0H16DRAFT_1458794 [Mycena metata]|uniref:Uncharacterized protein n=1 Tax=Mycena metata TaxID=1033252 RepID=A0AAD7NBV1_9AGAR|nr:hypothetical protein B0H16DRAFT_1458794 [Mycena metata]
MPSAIPPPPLPSRAAFAVEHAPPHLALASHSPESGCLHNLQEPCVAFQCEDQRDRGKNEPPYSLRRASCMCAKNPDSNLNTTPRSSIIVLSSVGDAEGVVYTGERENETRIKVIPKSKFMNDPRGEILSGFLVKALSYTYRYIEDPLQLQQNSRLFADKPHMYLDLNVPHQSFGKLGIPLVSNPGFFQAIFEFSVNNTNHIPTSTRHILPALAALADLLQMEHIT